MARPLPAAGSSADPPSVTGATPESLTPANTGAFPVRIGSAPVFELLQDKYQVIAELGRGGMATVFLGVHRAPGGFRKLQVIKRLRPELVDDTDFLAMFLDEARLAARLDHPNVVHTNEVACDGQHYFIAMEYLEGQTYDSLLRRAKQCGITLPVVLHLHILTKILEGLHYAHDLTDFDGAPLNVVHRDVSPQNVMITYSGHVKVLDFGIAKAAGSTNNTRTGIVKGKFKYMAPEQLGSKGIDRRADIFTVGIMLWQALAGRRMWEGLEEQAICALLITGQVPLLREFAPDVDPRLEAFCMKALAINPADRFATAAEMLTQLEDCVAERSESKRSAQLAMSMTELFTEKRAQVRQLIEDHIKSTPLIPSAAPSAPVMLPPSSVPKFHSTPAGGSNTNNALALEVPAAPKKKRAVLGLIAAGLTLLTLLTLVSGVLVGRACDTSKGSGEGTEKTTARAADEPGAAAVSSKGAAVPPVASITVRVTARPASATIFIDDVPLGTTPIVSTREPGGRHELRVQAAGYKPHSETVDFGTDVVRSVQLERATPVFVAPPPIAHPTGRGAVTNPPSPNTAVVVPAKTAPPPSTAAPAPPPPPPQPPDIGY